MFYDTAKRALDIFSAILLTIVFLPLIVLIAIAVKVDSPGPVIFWHRRVGKNKKIFLMAKFRTMIDHADEYFTSHPDVLKEFKKKEGWKFGEAKDDPRITRVGRFIRRFSLDELPQVWNILNGDMSLVGPRAYRKDMLGDEVEEQLKFHPDLRKTADIALSVKPGLTGLWQVSGRNVLSWDKRIELDAEYAKKKSLLFDLYLILRTPPHMLNKW